MLARAAAWLCPSKLRPDAMSVQDDRGDGRVAAVDGIEPKHLDAVYRIEAPRLFRLLKRRIWAEDERHDIVQEAFARLAGTRSSGASMNPGAYLQGIVRHLLADRVRRWSRRQSLDIDMVPQCGQPDAPDAAAEVAQMRRLYRAAVDRLPVRTREVYLLHRVEELTYREIAERCGISVRTVEWHVAQAIMRISKSISADG
jgi:RNA polymerase sigma-70 factor (ECF subfamily)